MNSTLTAQIQTAITTQNYKLLQATLRQCRSLGYTTIKLNSKKVTLISEAQKILDKYTTSNHLVLVPTPAPQPKTATEIETTETEIIEEDDTLRIIKTLAMARGYAEAEATIIANKVYATKGNPEAYAKAYRLYITRLAA